MRLATNALQQLSSPTEATQMATPLQRCCLAHGITFLSLGSTGPNGSAFLANKGCISSLAASLTNTSFTVQWLPQWGLREAHLLAEEIFHMAEMTNGGANFRFGVAFNCPPGIPFFPAAEAPADNDNLNKESQPSISFALGLENSGLLYTAFQKAAAASKLASLNEAEAQRDPLAAAHAALIAEATAAMQPLETIAKKIESTTPGIFYTGIDTSIAPALEPPTIPAAFECLGIGKFGASGTLAITERITAALKSVPVKRTGYCGLMLPVCEEEGLAAAAAQGRITIENLLQWSAVCGVGLDTVPVAGPGPDTTPEERQALISRVAGVLLDVAALSQRLNNKPLSVRLLPVVGSKAGQATAFNNPYLVESVVMEI